MEKFLGSFTLERSELFDEYLSARGVPWLIRKMMQASWITKTFTKVDDVPTYSLLNKSPMSTLIWNFQLGKQFEGKGFDGKMHKITFETRDGELFETHVRVEDPQNQNHAETYRYEITGEPEGLGGQSNTDDAQPTAETFLLALQNFNPCAAVPGPTSSSSAVPSPAVHFSPNNSNNASDRRASFSTPPASPSFYRSSTGGAMTPPPSPNSTPNNAGDAPPQQQTSAGNHMEQHANLAPCPNPICDEYLAFVAHTGRPLFEWSVLKLYFCWKLERVMLEMAQCVPFDQLQPAPNTDRSSSKEYVERILKLAQDLEGVPFTIQRLCELLWQPRKHYKRADKFYRALEKSISVVTTVGADGKREIDRQPEVVVPPPTTLPPPLPTVNGELGGEPHSPNDSMALS